MSALSPILRDGVRGDRKGVQFWCPGCKHSHLVYIDGGGKPSWSWNGDVNKPTFKPSVVIRTGHHVPGQPPADECWLCKRTEQRRAQGLEAHTICGICHSWVTDGRIEFLSDSTHDLAGQTVDLPPFPDDQS